MRVALTSSHSHYALCLRHRLGGSGPFCTFYCYACVVGSAESTGIACCECSSPFFFFLGNHRFRRGTHVGSKALSYALWAVYLGHDLSLVSGSLLPMKALLKVLVVAALLFLDLRRSANCICIPRAVVTPLVRFYASSAVRHSVACVLCQRSLIGLFELCW